MREYYITKNDSGQRLNKFLEKAVPLLSGGMMHKYLRLKRIKVNNKRTEAAYKLAEGDSVQLYLNDEYFDAPKEEEAFRRIKTPRVRVVYEDEHILLADKAPGMVVHADEHGDTDTLIAHIQAYLFSPVRGIRMMPRHLHQPCATVSTATPAASSSRQRPLKRCAY